MEKPKFHPSKRCLKLYTLGNIRAVSIDLEATAQNEEETNEWKAFRYDVVIHVSGEHGAMDLTDSEFTRWLKYKPDISSLWYMLHEFQKKCDEWEKYLRCEQKDLETYKRLKKKFE